MHNDLTPWLHAQTLWLCMAITYNVIGIYRMSQGGRALVGDQPANALKSLPVLALPILFGYVGWEWAYGLYLPVTLYLLARIGFWRHIIANRSEEGRAAYSSRSAWYAAVMINGYGTIVFFIGFCIALTSLLSDST